DSATTRISPTSMGALPHSGFEKNHNRFEPSLGYYQGASQMIPRARIPRVTDARSLAVLSVCAVAAFISPRPAATQTVALEPAMAAQLRYRYIGPVGNRVSSVAGVPGDPNTYYAGAASGGIWKS